MDRKDDGHDSTGAGDPRARRSGDPPGPDGEEQHADAGDARRPGRRHSRRRPRRARSGLPTTATPSPAATTSTPSLTPRPGAWRSSAAWPKRPAGALRATNALVRRSYPDIAGAIGDDRPDFASEPLQRDGPDADHRAPSSAGRCMIPAQNIVAWSNVVPWSDLRPLPTSCVPWSCRPAGRKRAKGTGRPRGCDLQVMSLTVGVSVEIPGSCPLQGQPIACPHWGISASRRR